MELKGPRAKLNWAIEKLRTLEIECGQRLAERPLQLVSEFDETEGAHILRMGAMDEFPVIRWGLCVGDVVHNARSGLDQAAWVLACRTTPVEELWDPKIGRKISFPLARKPSVFKKHTVIPYLERDAVAVIEPLQPYNQGTIPTSLGQLDELWNIDKHRVIHATTASLDVSGLKFRPKAVATEDLIGPTPPQTTWHELSSPVFEGAKVATVRFRDGRGPPLTGVDVTGHPKVELSFGGGLFSMSINSIGGLLVATSKTLELIEALP